MRDRIENQVELIHNTPWRTLWVMDAMRLDVFREIIQEENIEHPFTGVFSSGCETGMWIRNTWNHRHYDDITLVSNSAIWWKQQNRGLLERFHRTVPLWRDWREIDEGASYWGAVMPTEEVLEYAEKEHIVKPKKRLLIHDIPPHLPYCTDEGLSFLKQIAPKKTVNIVIQLMHYGRNNKDGFKTIRHHYKESARKTLKTILACDWLRERGELVITSDHGEMIGEGGFYGHSVNYKSLGVLRHVPWMTVNPL